MKTTLNGLTAVTGQARLYLDDGRPKPPFAPNLVLYDWGTIVAKLLCNEPDGKNWHIGAIYFEFENNSGAVVSPPTPARDEGKSYYDGLSVHATQDYLRVPVLSSQITSSDATLFPDGNVPAFYAQATGTVGVHGKTFSAAQQSRVFGVALVATPDFSDATQDKVFARKYYTTDEQIIKPSSVLIGCDWQLTLN